MNHYNKTKMPIDVKIIGSTKPGFELPKEEALIFGAQEAGICYMPDSFGEIQKEKKGKTRKRQRRTLNSGHHSVYGHTNYNLLIEGIPKILAMVLNNEKVYVTSEKSARYTQMDLSAEEERLFDKWFDIFASEIKTQYPRIDEEKRGKLAQENARYVNSVFTPTIMGYTTNLRQLNYIMHWFNEFIGSGEETVFSQRLKKEMAEFNESLRQLEVPELDPNVKIRNLSLFARRERFNEIFDEVYSTTYQGSFAQLAQAHRHRTVNYEMQPMEDFPTEFFVPPILSTTELKEEWLEDIASVSELFPQGSLLTIHETGTYFDFVSKVAERLCGQAQLEITQQTEKTLKEYLKATKEGNPFVHAELMQYNNGPRCTFPGYKCSSPCTFGKKGLERLI
jgi:hypothetical protein